jgi:hypothetical protein
MSTASNPSDKQITGEGFPGTPPSYQWNLKQAMGGELKDATWELEPEQLARALSAKTRKQNASPLTIAADSRDKLEYYDVKIDKLNKELNFALRLFKLSPLVSESNETDNYLPLCNFMNHCLKICCMALGTKKAYYGDLGFIKYDRKMGDRVKGAEPLKPDIAGTQKPQKGREVKFWWTPPTGERSVTMELPVEVKRDWKQLVSQAVTYARCLSYAEPLRQFSLVLAYNHAELKLRFLVFHAGGLTASTGLLVNEPDHRRDILRLFLSLLTWESPGDAGIPEWGNNTDMFVQSNSDDNKGVRMKVKKVLYDKLAICGCKQRVVHLQRPEHPVPTPPCPVPTSPGPVPMSISPSPGPVPTSPGPVSPSLSRAAPPVIVQLPRRSDRIAKREEARQKSGTAHKTDTATQGREGTYSLKACRWL